MVFNIHRINDSERATTWMNLSSLRALNYANQNVDGIESLTGRLREGTTDEQIIEMVNKKICLIGLDETEEGKCVAQDFQGYILLNPSKEVTEWVDKKKLSNQESLFGVPFIEELYVAGEGGDALELLLIQNAAKIIGEQEKRNAPEFLYMRTSKGADKSYPLYMQLGFAELNNSSGKKESNGSHIIIRAPLELLAGNHYEQL